MEALTGILELEIFGITVRRAGLALAILFGTLLVRRIAVRVVLQRIHRVTQKTAAAWQVAFPTRSIYIENVPPVTVRGVSEG